MRWKPSTESALGAVALGLRDRLLGGDAEPELGADVRMDGQRVLITGASAGLGLAIAKRLARRGATLELACRSGFPEVGDAVRRLHPEGRVAMCFVDLSDLRSIERLLDRLDGPIDRVVLNAGVVPKSARRTPQGFELMFAVNYLANAALVEGLLERRLLVPNVAAPPRVIAVSSESHRSVEPRQPAELGRFVEYGVRGSMREYSQSKLLLSAWVGAMSRRFADGGRPTIAFHHTCPGAVATNIAREAPALAKPILDPLMRAFFKSPDDAAGGTERLTAAPDYDGRTNVYLHVLTEKAAAPAVEDAAYGDALLAATERLLALGHPPEGDPL